MCAKEDDPSMHEHWCKEHNKEEFYVIDPFQADVYNEEVYMWLCADCEQGRADDI